MYWGGVTKSIIADPTLFVYSPFSQISQIFVFVFVTIYHLREEIFRLLFKQRFKFCAADLFFFQKQLCALMQHITVFQNQCLCLCITLVDNPVDFSVDLPAHQLAVGLCMRQIPSDEHFIIVITVSIVILQASRFNLRLACFILSNVAVFCPIAC